MMRPTILGLTIILASASFLLVSSAPANAGCTVSTPDSTCDSASSCAVNVGLSHCDAGGSCLVNVASACEGQCTVNFGLAGECASAGTCAVNADASCDGTCTANAGGALCGGGCEVNAGATTGSLLPPTRCEDGAQCTLNTGECWEPSGQCTVNLMSAVHPPNGCQGDCTVNDGDACRADGGCDDAYVSVDAYATAGILPPICIHR